MHDETNVMRGQKAKENMFTANIAFVDTFVNNHFVTNVILLFDFNNFSIYYNTFKKYHAYTQCRNVLKISLSKLKRRN